MKMKKTVEVLVASQSHRIANPTSEFDDDKEIQEKEDDAQSRTDHRKPNIVMMEPGLLACEPGSLGA
jgi:hypothetical protein